MVTEIRPKSVTAEELLKLDAQGFYGELIRGVLCEMPPPGIRHGKICLKVGSLLLDFVERRHLGTVASNDAGVWLERDPDTVRGPDVSFFSSERMPLDSDIPGYAEMIPDLVVEVRSSSDSLNELHDKALMWLSYGARLVWVVVPETRTVDVFRSSRDISTVSEGGALQGGDVLPGFRCSLDDIFGPRLQPSQEDSGDQSSASA